MALASGAIFAGYTVVRMLGSGDMGEVYLVRHKQSAGQLALKILPAEMSAEREFRRRFAAETEIVAKLHHPHIVAVHQRGESAGRLWIAMDYIDGSNVGQVMRERHPAGMPPGPVLSIVRAVAWALDHAHQRGLLHRAVKPASILMANPVAEQQRILLTDFGIALGRADSAWLATTNRETLRYAAPEQLTGSSFDGRADQYALGAMAFHLLTGVAPFGDSNSAAVVGQRGTPAPPQLRDRRPDLARLDPVMSRALAWNPADRFTRCNDFAVALAEQAFVLIGDHGFGAIPTFEYPADPWPETEGIAIARNSTDPPVTVPGKRQRPGTLVQRAAAALARRLDAFSTRTDGRTKTDGTMKPARIEAAESPPAPPRRRYRRVLVGAAALLLLGSLVSASIMVALTDEPPAPTAGPPTTASARPTTQTSATATIVPLLLDGTYRIEVERANQTFNDVPSPQPPNVITWWAFRTSCRTGECVAAGTLLDDDDHTRAKSAGRSRPLVLRFGDGQWKSRPETVQFPCVGPDGRQSSQSTTQVLSLGPQPEGHLVGEVVVTVHSNECGQQDAVIRVPVVASRSGDLPPALTGPNPRTVTDTSTAPTTTTSGPGR
ncbi:serine/threonine-protein kinase [Mycobacterium spongiae]|uniref:non-specific serine/threonine protein kinase n=1 Tax=Mycobacterium spongiae TaxID=886343 RepID=A0A975PWM5_9MYCO|nr:serine/threonine-protein kinase [Mycobacterium spongiae]QUR66914.1 protein kinase [Mycobacterium spongiae]